MLKEEKHNELEIDTMQMLLFRLYRNIRTNQLTYIYWKEQVLIDYDDLEFP